MIRVLKSHPKFGPLAEKARLLEIDSRDYYGKGYEDVLDRVPSVAKANRLLGMGAEDAPRRGCQQDHRGDPDGERPVVL
jgi:hypothetical protein